MDEHMIPIIKKHFPSHKFLFAYRDCLPCSMSFYKAFGSLPQVMNNIYHANKELLSGDLRKLQQNPLARHGWLTYTNGYDMQFCLQVFRECKPHPNSFEYFVLSWATELRIISRHQSNGMHFHLLKYEDLQADPHSMVQGVFDYLDISADLLEIAYKSMEQDSQLDTYFSREKKIDNKSWVRTAESDQRCNAMLKAFDFPKLGAKTVL